MKRRREKRRQINLRINEDLRRRLECEADNRGVSMNWLMTWLIKQELARADKIAETDRMCRQYANRI
jgi:predicted HicB family RNase H-like nuclease